MVPLATRNLLADTRRFAMSVAGVAFAVLLVLIVLSLYRGWSDVGRLYERLPGELWLSQSATSDPFHSTSFLPLTDGGAGPRCARDSAGGLAWVRPLVGEPPRVPLSRVNPQLDPVPA